MARAAALASSLGCACAAAPWALVGWALPWRSPCCQTLLPNREPGPALLQSQHPTQPPPLSPLLPPSPALSPLTRTQVRKLAAYLKERAAQRAQRLAYTPATVTRVVPVGMGDRACVDLASLLVPGEGLAVGSFARG